jgi:hypothetical protein
MPRYVELTDYEIETRSVLMRLYRSHWEGETSYPAVHVNGAAPYLEAMGWIEKAGDGWRITQDGILQWAEMNRKSLSRQWVQGAEQFEELRRVLRIKVSDPRHPCNWPGCRKQKARASNGNMYSYCPQHLAEKQEAEKRKKFKD